jgi:hypothetical protein
VGIDDVDHVAHSFEALFTVLGHDADPLGIEYKQARKQKGSDCKRFSILPGDD